MRQSVPESKYVALAELRYRIREFVWASDAAAKAAGLEPQHYQMLLALRALPHQTEANIGRLAERLFLKHHSAVGLVDRLEARGYVRRDRSARDQRQVVVSLLPKGQQALEHVVRQRLHELRERGHALVSALAAILEDTRTGRHSPRRARDSVRGSQTHAKRRRATASRAR